MKRIRPWDCSAVQERLGAFFQGDLAAADRAAVKQHLGGCAACSAAADLEDGLVRLSDNSSLPPLPESFAARVVEKRRDQGFFAVYKRASFFAWGAFSAFAFRTFCDPLLWVEFRLRAALVSAQKAIIVPLVGIRFGLVAESEKVYRQIKTILGPAYRQVSLLWSN